MQRQRKDKNSYIGQIDFIFYHEEEIREAVLNRRIYQSYGNLNGGGLITVNENGMSDPTARQAVKNLSLIESVVTKSGYKIKRPESWLIVIDKTYNWCKAQKDCRYEIAQRRYNGEDYRKTCHELNISNSTRRRLFELVQMYAALQAVQFGLIQV